MTTSDWGTSRQGQAQEPDEESPLYCYRHPNEPTYLRCAKCERPICAKCRVSTPVGFRCIECANLQVLPTYAVGGDVYGKAAIFGLAVAAFTGVLMGVFPGFEFWAALIMGVTVPEAVARASNQKRGPGLQMVAMACIVFGFVVSRVVLNSWPDLVPMGGINQPSYAGVPAILADLPFYLSQYSILWLALALFLANRRLA